MRTTDRDEIKNGFKAGVGQQCVKVVHLNRLLGVLKSDAKVCQSGMIYNKANESGCPMFHMTDTWTQNRIIEEVRSVDGSPRYVLSGYFGYKLLVNPRISDEEDDFKYNTFTDYLAQITRAEMIEAVEELIKEKSGDDIS